MASQVGVAERLVTYAQMRHRILNRRKTAIWALVAASAALVAITVAGRALGEAARATDFGRTMLPPSTEHIFGTDWMGRDLFARTIAGLSTSILIGLFAAFVSALIAALLGALAALGPKWMDAAITWLVDLVMGVPHILLLILISFALGRGFWGVAIGVAVTHWPALARVLRAEIMQLKNAPYVRISRKLGRGPWRVGWQHMVPAVLPQFVVGLVLLFPHAILHEAAITFLGFGLPPEQPAIGIILSESMSYLATGMWWAAFFPGLALLLVVMGFDAIGGALRVLVTPSMAQE